MSMSKVLVRAVGPLVLYMIEKGAEKIYDAYRRKEEEKTTKAMECIINECFLKVQKKMVALQEYLKKLQASRQCECQLLKAEFDKNQGTKEKYFARFLLSRMEEEMQQLLQRVQTLEENVQKWPETTKHELHLLRADLDKNQGKKEEEISRALECRVNQKFQQLLKEIQSLEEYLQKHLKSSHDDLQFLRAH